MGASVKNEPGDEPLIARDATYYRAPDALRARVRASVRAQAREQLRPMLWRWGGMAAGLLLAFGMGWLASSQWYTGHD